jgi:methyltransferase-like protein/cyclopropane fatty-acyl-phospholipid synthase-like methyltransferase
MTAAVSYSYDQVPYPDLSHYNTHPGSMGVIAALSGMEPAPVMRCRVLELGCAAGWNLIPMAYHLPESSFTGIDLSHRQIREGRRVAAQLGITNLRLEQVDFMELGPDLGEFDYIIAHGVFSWVPENVQEKILHICRENLAEQGVAYISYNTYPGWHLINIPRGIMQYYARHTPDPAEQVQAARENLDFYTRIKTGEGSPYAEFLHLYREQLQGSMHGTAPKDDSALLHDELEEANHPLYFYQFIERAEQHGLQYLADAASSKAGSIPAETLDELRQRASSLLDLEQSLDFLHNRTFRQTLLCREEVQLNRRIRPDSVRRFYLSSQAAPLSDTPVLTLVSVESFTSPDGVRLTIDHPLSKASMLALSEASPGALSFDELVRRARTRLEQSRDFPRRYQPADFEQDLQVLGANLLRAFSCSSALVDLHLFPDLFSARLPVCPEVSCVIRLQAQRGVLVTNLRHERVRVDDLDRFLITHLDGTRDLYALSKLVEHSPQADRWIEQLLVEQPQEQTLVSGLEERLDWYAKNAMIVDRHRSGE